jgi:hypothetical protein
MTSESAVTAACVCEEPDTILLLFYTTRSSPWSLPLMRAQAAFPAAGGRGQFVFDGERHRPPSLFSASIPHVGVQLELRS